MSKQITVEPEVLLEPVGIKVARTGSIRNTYSLPIKFGRFPYRLRILSKRSSCDLRPLPDKQKRRHQGAVLSSIREGLFVGRNWNWPVRTAG